MCAAGHLFVFALTEGGPPTHPSIACLVMLIAIFLSGVLANVLW